MWHGNARSNERGRQFLVQCVRFERWAVAHAAIAQGVSSKCAHRWRARFDGHGIAAPADRSSRPRSCRRHISEDVERRVMAVLRGCRRGQDWIGPELGVAPHTVPWLLRRYVVRYVREYDPLTCEVFALPRPQWRTTNVTPPEIWATWTSRESENP
ncbi:MAG: leucine zipper domain-containing protein [Demequina sp.]|uniref:leucine zipper domain-containing protein n=1 Tax=Demequina sp. TaxID=2050685 RepID=UPI003A856D5C